MSDQQTTKSPPLEDWESKSIFENWLYAMEWTDKTGLQKAARALGKDRRMIERYASGETKLKKDTRLAMAAIKANLMAWGDKTEHAAGNFLIFGGIRPNQISDGDLVRIAKADKMGSPHFFDAEVLKKSAWGDAFKVRIVDAFNADYSWLKNPYQWIDTEVIVWPQHIYMGRDKYRQTYRSTANSIAVGEFKEI